MSQTPFSTASGTSSNFRSIFDAALTQYKRKTKNDLIAHRLTAQLESCSSPGAILAVLDEQYHVQQFIRSQSAGEGSKQWLYATACVLCAFSDAIGEGVGLVLFHDIDIIVYVPINFLTGIFSCESDFCRRWGPSRCECSL
jgi:hypothetical protein